MGVQSPKAQIAIIRDRLQQATDELSKVITDIEFTLEALLEDALPSETESVEWLPAPGSPADSVQGVHILHGQTTYTTDPDTPCPIGGKWVKSESVFLRSYAERDQQGGAMVEHPCWSWVSVMDPPPLPPDPDQQKIQF